MVFFFLNKCASFNSEFSVPQDGFLLGCVFAIADYPEQMADKHLLATWKKVIYVKIEAI